MYIYSWRLVIGRCLFIAHVLTFSMLSALAHAETADANNKDLTHQELRQLKKDMQDALNELDVEKELTRVTEDAVFTTMNGDRAVGRENIRKYFEKMLKGPDSVVKKVTVNFEVDELAHLYGDDAAVAFGTSKDQYLLKDGTEFVVEPKWSATMVRQNGKWLIASFHYSTNMFDNPILIAQRKMLLIGGALLSIIFALIGFFIGKKVWKK